MWFKLIPMAARAKVVDGSKRLAVLSDPREIAVTAWLQLVRTFCKVHRRMEAVFSGHGLTAPQFDVLASLRGNEGITQQELAGRLLVSKGNITFILERMERAGWVERRPDRRDGRTNRLYLTDGGADLLADVLPDHHASLADAFKEVGPPAMRSLTDTLAQIERSVDG